MRSEISFDHHSFQNDPGMTVFGHSDLILSFETKDERNEVDKVPYRENPNSEHFFLISQYSEDDAFATKIQPNGPKWPKMTQNDPK